MPNLTLILQLTELGVKLNHSREYTVMILNFLGLQLGTYASLAISQLILTNFGLHHSIPSRNILFIYAIHSQRNFWIFKLSIIAAAKTRLSLINRGLEERTNSIEAIRKVFFILDKFGDSIEIINKCLAVNLLMGILEFLFHTTMQIFNVYNIAFNEGSLESKVYFTVSCIFFPTEAFYMMSVITYSSLLKKESNRTLNLIIKKTLKWITNHKTLNFLQLALLKMKHQNLKISCGLFTIDWTFLFTIISGSFSIAIILIQFDLS